MPHVPAKDAEKLTCQLREAAAGLPRLHLWKDLEASVAITAKAGKQ